VLICGAGALGCQCAPHVALHVSPQAYCPGTPIHLEWVATGDVSLKISPEDTDFVSVANSRIWDLPPADRSIELQALWHDRRDGVRVEVARVASRPLVGPANDCDAGGAKTQPIPFPPGLYDRRARLDSIASSCHSDEPADPCPEITVCLGASPTDPCAGGGARRWQVAPGHTLDVSHDAVDLAGYWVLARKLLPGESCGPADAAHPAPAAATTPKMTHLKVQLNLSCAPQGATS